VNVAERQQSAADAFHDVVDALLARVEDISHEQITAVLIQLAAAQTSLAARLATRATHAPTRSPRGDRLLTVHEAAAKLRVTVSWLYRNAARLPFTVRPSPRRLRFSELGIEQYIAQRRAASHGSRPSTRTA
jgi:predicted DNA-binding transcriptional regulator AlpA